MGPSALTVGVIPGADPGGPRGHVPPSPQTYKKIGLTNRPKITVPPLPVCVPPTSVCAPPETTPSGSAPES